GFHSRRQCLLVTAEAVVEDRGNPVRDYRRQSLAAGRGLLDAGLDERSSLCLVAAESSQHHGSIRREWSPGCLTDRVGLRYQRHGGREVTAPHGVHSHPVQQDRELVERTGLTGELYLQHCRAPAIVAP